MKLEELFEDNGSSLLLENIVSDIKTLVSTKKELVENPKMAEKVCIELYKRGKTAINNFYENNRKQRHIAITLGNYHKSIMVKMNEVLHSDEEWKSKITKLTVVVALFSHLSKVPAFTISNFVTKLIRLGTKFFINTMGIPGAGFLMFMFKDLPDIIKMARKQLENILNHIDYSDRASSWQGLFYSPDTQTT